MASSPATSIAIEAPTEPRADREARVAARYAQETRETRNQIVPRADRLGTPISGENAQGRLSPDATIFAANLPMWVPDEQLRTQLEAKLAAFGPCFAKVRRDRQGMPMAFVSFLKTADAGLALGGAGTLSIEGRPLRVEQAKADRAVLMTRRRGGQISHEEVQEVLGRFGPIEETSPISIGDQTMGGLPEGRWVKFAFYEDCHEAETSLRRHSVYRLLNHHLTAIRPATTPQEPRSRPIFQRANAPATGRRSNSRPPRLFYEPCAIYIGNLPSDIAEEEILEAFAQFGVIARLSILQKGAQGSAESSAYCFINFEDDESVSTALHTTPLIRNTIFPIDRKHIRPPVSSQERRFKNPKRVYYPQTHKRDITLDPQGRHYSSYQPYEYYHQQSSRAAPSAQPFTAGTGCSPSDNRYITGAESQQPTDSQTPEEPARPITIMTEDGQHVPTPSSRNKVRSSVREGTTFFHHDDNEPDAADHAHPAPPSRSPVPHEPVHSTPPAYSVPSQPAYPTGPAYSRAPHYMYPTGPTYSAPPLPLYWNQPPSYHGYQSYPPPNVMPCFHDPDNNSHHYYNGGFGYSNPLSHPHFGHHGQSYHY